MLFLFMAPPCKFYLEKSAIGGSMLNINCDIVGKMVTPIPPLSEQSRIVSILDTFEASIANLEAQLSQREKKYEYYRNKLLTFE
jgi:restriction endonuclease S subunit